MKKLIASLVAGAAILSAGSAFASPLDAVKGDYVQASGGAQFGNNYGGGAAWSVAAGRDFGLLRAEVEYLGANLGVHGTAQTANLNAYVQPVTVANVTPFVGTGVGYGRISGNADTGLLNASAGGSYSLTNNLKLVVQYRYTHTTSYNQHTSLVSGGLRVTF